MIIDIQLLKWNRVFHRWEVLKRSSYCIKPVVLESYRVLPALVEKRLQSLVHHQLPALYIWPLP